MTGHPDVSLICPTCGTSARGGVAAEVVIITTTPAHGERYEVIPCPTCRGGR